MIFLYYVHIDVPNHQRRIALLFENIRHSVLSEVMMTKEWTHSNTTQNHPKF